MFGVAQQVLGSDMTGLYQAWDRAILLDQVFSWVQLGRAWSPASPCEEDEAFVGLLGAMSALIPGAANTPPTLPLANQNTSSTVSGGAAVV